MNGQWNLINAAGNIVRKGTWQNTVSSMTLETSTIPPGVYFYVFSPEIGIPFVQKLVISR